MVGALSAPCHTGKKSAGTERGLDVTYNLRAVVTVTKSLNMDVTAEGIETDQQRLELKNLGCDQGQGFLFARPVAPEHLKPLLAISVNGTLVGV